MFYLSFRGVSRTDMPHALSRVAKKATKDLDLTLSAWSMQIFFQWLMSHSAFFCSFFIFD